MVLRLAFALAAVSALASACSDDSGNNTPFDGNFIVGDAAVSDLGPGPSDSGSDDSGRDADAADSGSDRGPLELGPSEAGAADGSDAQASDGGPDPCAAEVEETLTASAAIARGGSLAGRVVEVAGRLGLAAETCTELACGVDEPCCNTCFAALRLDGVLPVGPSGCLPNVGCSGDECGLVCRPAVLGSPGLYVGRIQHDANQGTRLELIEVRR